jgi:membrane protease YdiL (CAAX protease family)
MEAKKIKLSTAILSIAIIAAIEIVVRLLTSRHLLMPWTGLGLARMAEIIFLLLLVKKQEKSLSAIGLVSTRIYAGLKKGLIWAVSFGFAAAVTLFVIYLLGINVANLFQVQLPAGIPELAMFFLMGAIIGPIAEEIFFRGILYGFFRKWGILTALILSTLFFVLPHTTGNSIPLTQLIGGILFAASYEREKNLLVPMTIHSLGNLAIFSLAAVT